MSVYRESLKKVKGSSEIIARCLDKKDKFLYFWFIKRNSIVRQYKSMPELIYVHFSLLKERKKFYKERRTIERIQLLREKGAIKLILEKLVK